VVDGRNSRLANGIGGDRWRSNHGIHSQRILILKLRLSLGQNISTRLDVEVV
jgi:hypothetical protein